MGLGRVKGQVAEWLTVHVEVIDQRQNLHAGVDPPDADVDQLAAVAQRHTAARREEGQPEGCPHRLQARYRYSPRASSVCATLNRLSSNVSIGVLNLYSRETNGLIGCEA